MGTGCVQTVEAIDAHKYTFFANMQAHSNDTKTARDTCWIFYTENIPSLKYYRIGHVCAYIFLGLKLIAGKIYFPWLVVDVNCTKIILIVAELDEIMKINIIHSQ